MAFRRRGCFVCVFVLGHLAENCSFSERRCFNCLEAGHESSACEAPRTTDAKQCYGCGVSHIKADCPTVAAGKGRSGQACYTCGSVGHISRNCPGAAFAPVAVIPPAAVVPPAPRVAATAGASVRCHKCNGLNHFARDCKAPAVSAVATPAPARRQKTCFTCRKAGHIARDCPEAPAASTNAEASTALVA
ncbi:hypothetical protein IE53DRAFT_386626 [Violaceomyces palustris]|uniref:Uncharacterized protein n=1 Tax=Violaceomyces palustris TaxID=1673888 RepID=A0ACD0NYZ3_9BASI|nr:hypothetical protein IE53DRAFT_386626 [Violaceomyces palustris]